MCEDARFDINRRDTFTYWALTVFLATIAVYFQLLHQGFPPLWRLALVYVTGALMLRFFMHSCLAYAGIRRWRDLGTLIERYWAGTVDAPTLAQVKEAIETYDHQTKATVTRRRQVRTQLRAGFLLIIGVILILIIFEVSVLPGWDQASILMTLGALGYLAFEVINFLKYPKIMKPKKLVRTAPMVTGAEASS